MDGTYGIRVTMADFMGTGFKIDGMYTTDVGSGDAQADNGSSGETGGTSTPEYFAIADKYLSDAIALDAQKHPEETIFYTP